MSNRSYSYSDYSSAVACMRKYKLLKIDQVAQTGLSGDLEFGTALHAAITACLRGDEYMDVFDMYWADASNKEVEYGRFNWVELGRIGREFMRKFSNRYASDFKPQLMEKRLYGEYKGVKLEGTPDFVGSYKGTLVVADWKTTGYAYDKDKAKVALQLLLYTYLAITNLDFKPQQMLYLPFVKSSGSIQTPVVVEFNHQKMIDALDDMVHYLKVVDNETVFPKNLNSCIIGQYKCPMWEICHK